MGQCIILCVEIALLENRYEFECWYLQINDKTVSVNMMKQVTGNV